ncbi:MAG: exosortase system-associated protein, TIGR04073 family [Methylobacter sp.]|uniref:exosortase system-associated protein, TIGR04073 family n=1 Tax=Methylobacter sp. TaxID=2051955 RepID=UPI00272F2031|nr:exosortase system-associated protein, TIGR04073 family [Methylobacter sp.]MDP1667044.1 exosortase system-associated protein, TIGR04073 family [Methylobacter sp.]MDP1969310.1 exosortase system-associated protein, TIGR04073 family [Methylobacter sp.]
MRKFSRSFVFLLFASLFTAYAPMTQADMQQQGYGTPATQEGLYQHRSFGNSYGSKVGNKALNAFANLTTSVLEIPKNMINTTNQSNVFYGIIGGLFKGIVHTAGRIGVGIADLVTIPLPTQPIAYPVYIWEDFDIDTTYGPVFRLDQSQEAEPLIVQAPGPEPVVAAPIAPKPEPIDNTKQYHQETNQKLDAIFKKEMKK